MPEYRRARIFYFATLILTGRQDEIDGLGDKTVLNSPFIDRILTATGTVRFNEQTDVLGYDYIETVGKDAGDIWSGIDNPEGN